MMLLKKILNEFYIYFTHFCESFYTDLHLSSLSSSLIARYFHEQRNGSN